MGLPELCVCGHQGERIRRGCRTRAYRPSSHTATLRTHSCRYLAPLTLLLSPGTMALFYLLFRYVYRCTPLVVNRHRRLQRSMSRRAPDGRAATSEYPTRAPSSHYRIPTARAEPPRHEGYPPRAHHGQHSSGLPTSPHSPGRGGAWPMGRSWGTRRRPAHLSRVGSSRHRVQVPRVQVRRVQVPLQLRRRKKDHFARLAGRG